MSLDRMIIALGVIKYAAAACGYVIAIAAALAGITGLLPILSSILLTSSIVWISNATMRLQLIAYESQGTEFVKAITLFFSGLFSIEIGNYFMFIATLAWICLLLMAIPKFKIKNLSGDVITKAQVINITWPLILFVPLLVAYFAK